MKLSTALCPLLVWLPASLPAVALNGRLPGPRLRFTEGGPAVVRVHNRLEGATSMHWYGCCSMLRTACLA